MDEPIEEDSIMPRSHRRLVRTALTAAALVVTAALPGAVTAAADGAAVPPATVAPSQHSGARGATQGQHRSGVDDFVIASFNVLGGSHTDRRGPFFHPGFANSRVRMALAVEVLRRTNVDVVGFQELQVPQSQQFLSETGGEWDIYSGAARRTDNSIAWRRSRFRLVRGTSVAIPYFHGHRVQMPVVTLQSRSSGQRMSFMDVHNPANTRGPAGRWRRIAVAKERRVTKRLTAETHAPVFLTGDMNDRARFFCQFTRNGVMRSFLGGSNESGRCRPPRSGIDWILGNQHVSFRSHRIDRSSLVKAATDHPVVSAEVQAISP